MKNLPFVLWMLLFMPSEALVSYLSHITRPTVYSDGIIAISAIADLFMWFWVGYMLYEKKEKIK